MSGRGEWATCKSGTLPHSRANWLLLLVTQSVPLHPCLSVAVRARPRYLLIPALSLICAGLWKSHVTTVCLGFPSVKWGGGDKYLLTLVLFRGLVCRVFPVIPSSAGLFPPVLNLF